MSKEGTQLSNNIPEDKRKYIVLLIYVFASFIFIFGMVAFRIMSEWDLLMINPLVYGWDFFFSLLIFVIILSIIIFDEKEDILVLLISSLTAFFWEAFIEPFGWYFQLWEFGKNEKNLVVIWQIAYQLGLEFYAFYYLIGMFYLLMYKSDSKYKIHMILALFIGLTIVGWQGDIHIAMFDTYFLTFFIWFILNALHLISVIGFYTYFKKRK